MELLPAGFASQIAAVCQAAEDLTGVAETVASFLELAEAMGRGERRELVEEIDRFGLVDGLLDAERRTGDDLDEETVGRAIARWERLMSELS
jgi:hypothetical protein